MENNKEMTRAYILTLLLFLLSFCLPTHILAEAMPCLCQDTVQNDTTDCANDSTETHKAIFDHPDSMGIRPNPDFPPLILPDNIYRKECSVGNFGGTLSVGNSGAAVYSLGIEAPNGGSLMPQIALSYNSQSGGYGLAGYGVGITGLSVITRGGHDLFHDGRLAGVTYTTGDNLFLDGKRLLLQSGASLQDGAVYTVEGDPFTTVVTHGDCTPTTANTWFEITTGTGMTYLYGNTASSQIAYTDKGGQPRIAAWYISKATDKYHNYITYQYAVDNMGIRPTNIVYATNSAKSRGITNRISFAYQSLGDNARPFAIGDRQGKTDMCLSSITTTSNSSLYRKYTLTYDDSSDKSSGKWTRLVRVDVENGNGEKLPPLKLAWNFLPSPTVKASLLDVTTKDTRELVEETERTFLSADINGDGIGDIIRVSPVKVTTAVYIDGAEYQYYTYVYVSRSRVSPDGSVGYEPPLVYTLPFGISTVTIKSMFGGASVMDFDGDGYNDLVFPFQNKTTGLCNLVDFHIIFGKDVVAGKDAMHVLSVNLLSTDKAPLFATFDADGDGKDDVVCVEQRKKDAGYPCTIVRLHGNTVLDSENLNLTLPQGVDKDIEKIFVGDYNNDGLPDLLLLYNGGYKTYLNNGGSISATKFTEDNTKAGTDLGNQWRIQQGDFDGDGLTDFVYNKQGDSWLWIAHNNGDGTFAHTKAVDIGVADHDSSKDNDRFAMLAYDIDHDGRTDVVVCKAGYKHCGFPHFRNEYTDTRVEWLLSTGSGLRLACSVTKNREDDASEGTVFLGDFDGDGCLELANCGSLLDGGDDSPTEGINVYKAGNDLAQAGKITGFTDGMGNKTHVRYAVATKPTVYRRNARGAYPINTYTLPLQVVEEVTADNGAAGNQTTRYFYEDLRLHIAGGGMLGFGAVTADNTTLGTSEANSVTEWDEKFLIPTETRTTRTVGGDTSTAVSAYTVTSNGNNYFAYVSKTDITDLDGNTTTTLTNYDVSRGVIASETIMDDGGSTSKGVTYSGYQNKAGTWLPTTLTMTQKHRDDPSTYTTVTTYNYDDFGNVLSTTVNSGTDMALTTTSTYDAYGNVLSSVATGNGVKAVTKYNAYDMSGRFATRSHTYPASAVNTFTYDKWGNRLTESDETNPLNTLTTRYTYDGWGRRMSTLHADGTQTTYSTGWGDLADKLYFISEATTGSPSVTTWHDSAGHEVLQESVGANGVAVAKSTSYNDRGQVASVDSKTGRFGLTRTFDYDARGRVTADVLSQGKSMHYSYGNRSVTTTIAGRTYTKTFDAWGNTVNSIDPVGAVEYRYSSTGKPSGARAAGSIVAMTYDAAGNQTSLSDRDAGTSTYSYAADGALLAQTDGRGIRTTNTYDDLGRLAHTRIGQEDIAYTYGTNGSERLRLIRKSAGSNSVEYSYDSLGRVVAEKRNVYGSGTYVFKYAYNDNGQLARTTFPSGLEVTYQYDDNGFKTQTAIDDKVIYKAESNNGIESASSFLGKIATTHVRDSRGYESLRRMSSGSTVLENFEEQYDEATDNMLSRKRNNEPCEHFGYDDLDRLVSVRSGNAETMKMDFSPNGNITFKTGVGNYAYDRRDRPHAVISVDNADGSIPGDALNTTFGDLGKIQMIEDTGKGLRMDFTYGPDLERWCSEMYHSGANIRTTVYAGDYECIFENGRKREFHYLDGNTIAIRENGVTRLFVAFTDNLGSILSVIDEDGKRVFDASYDAWGKQAVRLNAIGLRRGYTGHEMLAEFDIINMNGRLYDPVLGRFFSPDNYVQMPDNSQSYNRYSYCLNNPLKYTDPSGEYILVDDILAAIIGGTLNVVGNALSGNIHSFRQGLAQFGVGALAGLASEYGGPVASSIIIGAGNSIVNQGFENGFNHIGLDNVLNSTLMSLLTTGLNAQLSNALSPLMDKIPSLGSKVLDNMLRQTSEYAISGFALGTVFALGSRESMEKSIKSGLDGMIDGAALGAMSGLGMGIREAHAEKVNPWTGEKRHGHHPFPKFLGGDAKQPLTEMSKSRHFELHKDMNSYLKGIANEEGKNMMPTRNNSGRDIQRKFSPEIRFNVTKTFYDKYPIKYWDARWNFYKNNGIANKWKIW